MREEPIKCKLQEKFLAETISPRLDVFPCFCHRRKREPPYTFNEFIVAISKAFVSRSLSTETNETKPIAGLLRNFKFYLQ